MTILPIGRPSPVLDVIGNLKTNKQQLKNDK